MIFNDALVLKLTGSLAIVMPDDVASEKSLALQALGATVEKVRPASIVDQKQVSLPNHSLYQTHKLMIDRYTVCGTTIIELAEFGFPK